jgi:dihydropteroate synthase
LGFGKDTEQCWNLLDNFAKLKQQIKCKIYVGHSRKSFLKPATNSIADKDIATSVVSKKLTELNCDYLRLHKIS